METVKKIYHNNTNIWRLPPEKFALMVVNTAAELKDAPYNNALLCKENFDKLGYFTNIMMNPSLLEFDALLHQSLLAVTDRVVIYYYGHSNRDGRWKMKDGYIDMERMKQLITKSRHCKKLTFMLDTCYASNFNLPDCTIICSSGATEESHQKAFNDKEYGVLTYFFWKYFDNPHCIGLLEMILKKFGQSMQIRGEKEMLF